MKKSNFSQKLGIILPKMFFNPIDQAVLQVLPLKEDIYRIDEKRAAERRCDCEQSEQAQGPQAPTPLL